MSDIQVTCLLIVVGLIACVVGYIWGHRDAARTEQDDLDDELITWSRRK